MNTMVRTCKLIAVVLLAACLYACSQDVLSESQMQQPRDTSEEQSVVDIPKNACENLVLITNRSGPMLTSHAVTQAGCYEVLMRSNGTGNMLYSDFNTKQKIFLSSQINSKHTDESDASFLPSVIGGASPMTDGTSLYLYKSGSKSLYDYYGDSGRVQITKMNLDGSSKKTLYFNGNQQVVRTSAIASDGTYLYGILLSIMPDTTLNYELVQLDVDNSKVQVLHSFGSTEQVFIIGVYSKGLVLKKVSLPVSETLEGGVTNIQQHELLTFDMVSHQLASIKQWEQNDVTSLCLSANTAYFVTNHKQMIHALSLLDGEEMTPISLPFPAELYDYEMDLGLDVFDNRLLIQLSSNENEYRFSFDLIKKELQPFTLMANQQFLTILGENADCFVVLTGEKMISFDDVSPDGILFKNQQNIPRIALIKKSDLWNNAPNYIEINDSMIS